MSSKPNHQKKTFQSDSLFITEILTWLFNQADRFIQRTKIRNPVNNIPWLHSNDDKNAEKR